MAMLQAWQLAIDNSPSTNQPECQKGDPRRIGFLAALQTLRPAASATLACQAPRPSPRRNNVTIRSGSGLGGLGARRSGPSQPIVKGARRRGRTRRGGVRRAGAGPATRRAPRPPRPDPRIKELRNDNEVPRTSTRIKSDNELSSTTIRIKKGSETPRTSIRTKNGNKTQGTSTRP